MVAFRDGHQIDLLEGSAQYFAALMEAMDKAQREIRLETYIFDFVAGGDAIAWCLIRAAERGVAVYVMMDGVGTSCVPDVWQARFAQAGVHWWLYKRPGRLGLLLPSRWRRLHRKLCVIDGRSASALGFCGGINVLDDYHDPNHGVLLQPRFDFAVSLRGPLVADMLEAALQLWRGREVLGELARNPIQTTLKTLARARALPWSSVPPQEEKVAPQALGIRAVRAALLLRDNVRNRRRIEAAYLQAIHAAQQEIIIANAYFLPGAKIRQAIREAARRGVQVKLLVQGRYEYFMQYHAAQPAFALLLRQGIEIHEYAASFLHAKVAVIDASTEHAWATVGSSNLDPLSLLLAREANVAVRDARFASQLRERLVCAMREGGRQMTLDDINARPWRQRILDRIAYGLMRLALALTARRY